MIFGVWNPEKIWHQILKIWPPHLSAVSHFTLENPKIIVNNTASLLRTSDYLRYLRIKRTVTVTVNLPTKSDKCRRTTL